MLKFGVFMAVRIILTGQFWQKLVFVLYIFRIVFWAKINIKNEFLSKFWVLYMFYSIIWPKLRKVTKRSCKNYSYRVHAVRIILTGHIQDFLDVRIILTGHNWKIEIFQAVRIILTEQKLIFWKCPESHNGQWSHV